VLAQKPDAFNTWTTADHEGTTLFCHW